MNKAKTVFAPTAYIMHIEIRKVLTGHIQAGSCLGAVILLFCTTAAGAFDADKFPGRGKREAFARSCQYDKKGIDLEERGKPREAIEQYKKAVEIYPYFAVHFSNLGNALSDLHRYTEAVEQYEKAVRLAPDFAAAYSNMADALTKQKSYHAAEVACKNALRVDPGYVPAMTNLGEIYLSTNRPRDARTILGQATGLATTAALKKIIAADLKRADARIESSGAKPESAGRSEMPR